MICRKCNQPDSPSRPFYADRNLCKECKKLEAHIWYLSNRERQLARNLQYRHDNNDALSHQRLCNHYLLKMRILTHYTTGPIIVSPEGIIPIPQCAICSETRIGALHVDHINNDGTKHRIETNIQGSHEYYKWIESHNYPPQYRILCANDNLREHLKTTTFSIKKTNISSRNSLIKTKQIFMTALGNKCIICGCTDIDVLTAHHINNNGAKHRKLAPQW